MTPETERENTGLETAELLNGKKILLVDDEPIITKTIGRSLQMVADNVQIRTANSGKNAIELIEQDGEPDIIVSDIMMPNGTGKELYEWLCENRPGLADKIFFISGGAAGNGIKEFFQLMLNKGRLLIKPLKEGELINSIRNRLLSVQVDGAERKDDMDAEIKRKSGISGYMAHKLNNSLLPIVVNVSEILYFFKKNGFVVTDDVESMLADMKEGNRKLKADLKDVLSSIEDEEIRSIIGHMLNNQVCIIDSHVFLLGESLQGSGQSAESCINAINEAGDEFRVKIMQIQQALKSENPKEELLKLTGF